MGWMETLRDADPFEVLRRNPELDPVAASLADASRGHYEDNDPPPPPPGKGDTLLTEAMPSLTDSDRRSAARKARARLLSRGGRSSTILTDDALGGGL